MGLKSLVDAYRERDLRGRISVNALEAAFTAHIEFICEHPGVPRMLFGELQRAEQTEPAYGAHLDPAYGERLERLVEEGKERGELAATLDDKAAVTLFIGTIQGLSCSPSSPATSSASAPAPQERSHCTAALSRRRVESSLFLGRHISDPFEYRSMSSCARQDEEFRVQASVEAPYRAHVETN